MNAKCPESSGRWLIDEMTRREIDSANLANPNQAADRADADSSRL